MSPKNTSYRHSGPDLHRDKLQPESGVPGGNRDPVFEMVPGFRRDGASTPVSTGVTTFYETIMNCVMASHFEHVWFLVGIQRSS